MDLSERLAKERRARLAAEQVDVEVGDFLPGAPAGMRVSRVDVVIRLKQV